VGVVGLEGHEEGHADGEGAHEADEGHSLADVLLELLGGDLVSFESREPGL
jgi:hypothetical protein